MKSPWLIDDSFRAEDSKGTLLLPPTEELCQQDQDTTWHGFPELDIRMWKGHKYDLNPCCDFTDGFTHRRGIPLVL